jgi:hypothetical protein
MQGGFLFGKKGGAEWSAFAGRPCRTGKLGFMPVWRNFQTRPAVSGLFAGENPVTGTKTAQIVSPPKNKRKLFSIYHLTTLNL